MFLIPAMEQMFFIRWGMGFSIQLGFIALSGAFHLSPRGDICAFALINIHYLYYMPTM